MTHGTGINSNAINPKDNKSLKTSDLIANSAIPTKTIKPKALFNA